MNIGEIARYLENFEVDIVNIGSSGRLRLNQLSITKKKHIVSISFSFLTLSMKKKKTIKDSS